MSELLQNLQLTVNRSILFDSFTNDSIFVCWIVVSGVRQEGLPVQLLLHTPSEVVQTDPDDSPVFPHYPDDDVWCESHHHYQQAVQPHRHGGQDGRVDSNMGQCKL